jgi:SsrA-binding protein
MSQNQKPTSTVIIDNKKALFDYEIIEEYEWGIVLEGSEVKSLRWGQANLKWAYITLHSGKPVLVGSHIAEYKYNTTSRRIDPKRERLILLSQKEITRLGFKVKEMGATLVPIDIHTKGNIFKVRLALAKGRKKWEKKQVLKERDLDREIHKMYR